MSQITEYLELLNLSEVESNLYLSLLDLGPISVRELAEANNMKRTTAYLYIDQLIAKGLVIKVVKGAHKLIAVDNPNALKALVDQKLAEAKIVKENFPAILQQIRGTLPEVKSLETAEIQFSKGRTALKRVYEDALKCKKLRVYANLGELESLFKANDFLLEYEVYEKALMENKSLRIYEIVADTPGTIDNFNLNQTVQTERYFYKHMPADVGLTAPGILMYDNKVAIINGKENFNVFVLHNTDYYINSIKLFDFIWKVLPN